MAVTAGLQYLNTSLATLVNPEEPEGESEGWLLEKTLNETFSDLMEKIKAFGKSNQVQEGVEEEPVVTVS